MQIYPFRALRYNTAVVDLEDVVTQPYDKISPAMQDAYYARSPFNLIRVILGKREPDTADDNVYTRAAAYLADWRQKNVLEEDNAPALFGYAQRYTVPGTTEVRERRGLICLGHLYDYAEKVVYRHEQTLSKPKSDRLSLFKATRTYCEQIYMLYADPAFTVEQLIFGNNTGEPATPPDQTVTDEYGVVHMLWHVTDPRTINLIVTALQDKKLIIADGHHRYETSTAYARERATELGLPDSTTHTATRTEQVYGADDGAPSEYADEHGQTTLPAPPFPEAAMMMTLVNMDAPGITILPAHRVVFGLPAGAVPNFLERAGDYFDVTRVDATHTAQDADAAKAQDAEQIEDASALLAPLNQTESVAFLAATRDGNYLLTAKPAAIEAALQTFTPRQRALDVVQLHGLVLEQLLGLSAESIRNQQNLRYLRSAPEAIAQVARGEADIAFLVKPVTLEQLQTVSLSGEVMPQKSTDFYPKLLSGLAFYALD
ncbi:DUF1015 domain-containing protein [Terriglobus sp.]|uniref:DUF1015 domain-containing protein n=1 Tax=Terriglobus sp. TaxID=1889013 RepID=UPI003AFF7B9B